MDAYAICNHDAVDFLTCMRVKLGLGDASSTASSTLPPNTLDTDEDVENSVDATATPMSTTTDQPFWRRIASAIPKLPRRGITPTFPPTIATTAAVTTTTTTAAPTTTAATTTTTTTPTTTTTTFHR